MRIIRPALLTIGLWCVTVTLAWAVNIHDVIELSRSGFADEDIASVIQTTHSVFTLEAEDIITLNR